MSNPPVEATPGTTRSLGHRAPLLWLVVPMAAGLIGARSGGGILSTMWTLPAAAAFALASCVAAFRNHASWVPATLVAGVLVGASSYELHRARLPVWERMPPREAQVVLRVQRTFAQGDDRKASGLGVIVGCDALRPELAGQRVYFSCSVREGEPRPRRSAIVTVSGVLWPLPRTTRPDTFDGYLASAGVNFRLLRGRVRGEVRPQRPYYRFCDQAAARFKTILNAGIESKRPTLAGLLCAMMLGETRELTEEQKTVFMQSGTMHLFAISGLNIGVIASALEAILLLLRLPPWVRFAIGVPLLWLFVDITGAAPSAIRAFAMATFFRAAFVFWRPSNTLAAIVGSAAIVLLVAPLQLFSASFVMSYGIVVALLVLALPLNERWCACLALWRDLPRVTWARWQRGADVAWRATLLAVAIGVATTLVSMLTGIQYFRLLTPAAFLANLILVPAAIIVTVGGFVSIVCGLLGFTLGASVCNHASALVLLAIERLVQRSVEVPGAFLAAEFRAPWIGHASLLLLLAALLFGYAARWQRAHGGWWPPFLIVAVTLLLGVRFAN